MVLEYESFLIKRLPPSAYYIPDFINDEEESSLIKNIYSVPKPKWTCLSNRRLQDYGGVPHHNGMIVEKIPEWLCKYITKIKDLNIYPSSNLPNHVLVNEYTSGQGIMPHTDGPLFHPMITTISCLSHTVLELKGHEPGTEHNLKILVEPKSLLILKDELYNNYLHSIREIKSDTVDEDFVNLDVCGSDYKIGDNLVRNTRISVTVRNVLKVLKLKLF